MNSDLKKLEVSMTWYAMQEYLSRNKKYRLLTQDEIDSVDADITTWVDCGRDAGNDVLSWCSNGVDTFKASKTVTLDIWLTTSEEYKDELLRLANHTPTLHQAVAFINKYL